MIENGKWERGCFDMIDSDGERFWLERYTTRHDDWRDTAIGPINMGYVRWGEERWMPFHPMDKEAERDVGLKKFVKEWRMALRDLFGIAGFTNRKA